MINFNENLCTTQWLDLVFQNRNQSYGAYQLRKHNNQTTTKAFLYACLLFSSLIIFPWVYGQLAKTVVPIKIPQLTEPVEVALTKIHEIKPVSLPPEPRVKREPLKSIRYTKPVVTPAAETNIEPPSSQELAQSVVGNVTSDGADATDKITIETPGGLTSGVGVPAENTVYSIDAVEKYPEFPGGQEAFAKYLSRNLRYPGLAAENGVQGKVLVSFIIERNGDLSQIKILRSIGGGCDEEAMRVLAKSPKWNPGVQNKQSVRVAYTIPINFKLPD